MTPTFTHEDRVIVFLHWPKQWFRRGQIVVAILTATEEPHRSLPTPKRAITEHLLVIKRILGLSGDVISLSSEGKLFVNEDFKDILHKDPIQQWDVPKSHCFLTSDDPTSRGDSRAFGTIPMSILLGIVFIKLPKRT